MSGLCHECEVVLACVFQEEAVRNQNYELAQELKNEDVQDANVCRGDF